MPTQITSTKCIKHFRSKDHVQVLAPDMALPAVDETVEVDGEDKVVVSAARVWAQGSLCVMLLVKPPA